MEIDTDVLGAMVAEVDEMHHQGMRDTAEQIAELHAGSTARTRRQLVRNAAVAGASGIVIALGSAVMPIERLLPGAAAADLDDPTIAAFAESLELAAVAAYQQAGSAGLVKSPSALAAMTTFAAHHKEHGAAFAAASGGKANHKPNPRVLQLVSDQITAARNENAVLQAAFNMENTAASTYLFALGALQGSAALQLTASILPVESQHAVVLGTALGKTAATDPTYLPSFITEQEKVDPTKFPPAT